MEKDKLKIQLRFMREENTVFSYKLLYNKSCFEKIGSLKVPKSIFYNQLIKSCDIGLSSVMVSKLLIKKKPFKFKN